MDEALPVVRTLQSGKQAGTLSAVLAAGFLSANGIALATCVLAALINRTQKSRLSTKQRTALIVPTCWS